MVEEEITLPENLRNLSNSDPQSIQHLQPNVRDSASTWPFPPQLGSSSEQTPSNPIRLSNDAFKNEALVSLQDEIADLGLETLDDLSNSLSSNPSLSSIRVNPAPILSAPSDSSQHGEWNRQDDTSPLNKNHGINNVSGEQMLMLFSSLQRYPIKLF